MPVVRTRFASLEGNHHPSLAAWRVGEAFAFRDAGGDEPPLVFLGQAGSFNRASPVTVTPNALGFPKIAAIFTDKMLYREGNDTVRVGVYVPGGAWSSPTFRLKLNGENVASPAVKLDANGLGLYELRDPVAGAYELELEGSKTSFTVAAYKLAPLTATLEKSEISGPKGKEVLNFVARLETYGAPLQGLVTLSLMDLGLSPPGRRGAVTLQADAQGRVSGVVALSGGGPFSLSAQVEGDAAKTASMPLPGSREADRDELVLSAWNQRSVARLVPFAGASPVRGVFVLDQEARTPTPVEVVTGPEGPALRLRVDSDAWCVVQLNRDGSLDVRSGRDSPAGTLIPLRQDEPWNLVIAGVLALGRAWEGRALRLGRGAPSVSVLAPTRAGPGATVEVVVAAPAGSTALVVVRDQRLQNADTPLSTTASSLRRQVEAGLALTRDGYVDRSLESLLPVPLPPPMPLGGAPVFRGGPGGGFFGGVPDNIPRPSAAPMRLRSAGPPMLEGAAPVGLAAPQGVAETAAGPPTSPARTQFPDVMMATLLPIGPTGQANLPVRLGDAMGSVAVDVFVATKDGDWGAANAELLVTRDVFGELTLPRFVAPGDFAEGVLVVRVASGSALATVTCDGKPVLLRGLGDPTETAFVSAPGVTLRFAAAAGAWVAEVRAHDQVDRSEGKVEEPGKLVWLQRAVRLLGTGDRLAAGGDVLALRVLPSLDATFDTMIGGLRSYEHGCCEQTSAVLLAAAAAWLTSKTDDQRRAASAHIRACVAREARMWLPGKGFKGWPEYPPEVFVFSPGATLNLLQVEMLTGFPLDDELAAAIKQCLEMARDAATAHGIDQAPGSPQSAREAYNRFGKFIADRQRMAAFIRERIEPWEKSMAILKFKVPGMTTESWNSSPAMIRAETAFGAATLLEAGGEHIPRGFELANTVLGAIRENGSLYSTLDSVAAITLLSALRNAKLDTSGTRVRIDGVEMTGVAAAELSQPAAEVVVVSGTAQVQVERLVVEDYTAIDQGMSAKVRLEQDGRPVTTLAPGDAVDLVISLTSGYQAGDLVHVFLPDALSWVLGGGQVKRFSLDLRGQNEIRVPLAATGLTLDADGKSAPQHYAVCLRNMYDERRGKGFGGLSVTVRTGGAPGLGGRIAAGLKSLFGV